MGNPQAKGLTRDEKGGWLATPEGGSLHFQGEAGSLFGEAWSSRKWLSVQIRHSGPSCLYLGMKFRDGEGREASLSMNLLPDLDISLALPLSALSLETLFLPPTPGRLKNVSLGQPVKPEEVTELELVVPPSLNPRTLELGEWRVLDEAPQPQISGQPLVDGLGQWMARTWEGKAASLEEARSRWVEEAVPSSLPDRDRFGGWTGLNLGAEGRWRTEQVEGQWWLVTPDGSPFFSVGPDCVTPHQHGPIAGMESLFSEIPSSDLRAAWDESRGVSFATANLMKMLGEDWEALWSERTKERLLGWGFNTVANWSQPGLGAAWHIPYVVPLRGYPTTEARVFRDFPDVFSTEFQESARSFGSELASLAKDPFFLGYFMSNEPNWAFGAYCLADLLLSQSLPLESRKRLIQWLEARHGSVSSLNRAWGSDFARFQDLMAPQAPWAERSPGASADLWEFTGEMVAEFVKLPALACRAKAPRSLNLGARWAWIASDAFYRGAEHLDVFSINNYSIAPDPAQIAEISAKAGGKPVMIGEFHAGALDAGLPSNALQGVLNQEERGVFYAHYVEACLATPELVGCHYFQWRDQPALGRFDGENLNIGLVDVCDKPYEPLTRWARDVHAGLYPRRMEKQKPSTRPPHRAPREGF